MGWDQLSADSKWCSQNWIRINNNWYGLARRGKYGDLAMGTLGVVAGVLAILAVWIVRTRSARRRWLQLLDLPGMWILEGSEKEQVRIEFFGTPKDGQYIESLQDKIVAGNWRLSGSSLILTPNEREDQTFEIRSFESGRIGINGPGRDRQIFQKKANNVVPMRRTP